MESLYYVAKFYLNTKEYKKAEDYFRQVLQVCLAPPTDPTKDCFKCHEPVEE